MNEFWAQFFLLYGNKQQAISELADMSIVPTLFWFTGFFILWLWCFAPAFNSNLSKKYKNKNPLKPSQEEQRNQSNVKRRVIGIILFVIWLIGLSASLSEPLPSDRHYIAIDEQEYKSMLAYKSLSDDEQKIVTKIVGIAQEDEISKDGKLIFDMFKLKSIKDVRSLKELYPIEEEKRKKEMFTAFFGFALIFFLLLFLITP